jgi:hypothetical protein
MKEQLSDLDQDEIVNQAQKKNGWCICSKLYSYYGC